MIDWNGNRTKIDLAEIRSYCELYGRGSRVVRAAFAYRRLRNKLYYGLQQQWAHFWRKPSLDKTHLNVLLHLRGGLGDCAALWVAVQALRQQLPGAVFYYYTDAPDTAKLLMVPDEQNKILPKLPFRQAFDYACELCISFKTVYVKKERVAQLAPNFVPVLETSLSRQKELSYFLEDNYLLDDALGRFLYHQGATRLEAVRYLSALDFDERQAGTLPPKITQKDISCYAIKPPFVTVHSGINAAFKLKGKTPLKCWPKEEWERFIALFKQYCPQIQLVQVGGKNSPRLKGIDVCLVGQTPLEDLPAILQQAKLHIDGESGLVQLTRWLKTKAVVLFGPTAPCLFALPKNINLVANKCGHCMWLSGPKWHTQCRLGYSTCQNLAALHAQEVLETVLKELDQPL